MGEPVDLCHATARAPERLPQKSRKNVGRKKLALSYVKGLVELDPSSISTVDSNGMTLLHRACHEGDLDLVKYLILSEKRKIDDVLNSAGKGTSVSSTLNFQDIFGRTALAMAVSANHEAVVEEVLTYYDYLRDRVTSLMSGDKEIRKSGSFAKEDTVRFPHLGINLKDTRGQSALMIATRKGHMSILRRLLRAEGIDVNCRDDRMRGCLHFVCLQYFSSKGVCNNAAAFTSNKSEALDQRHHCRNALPPAIQVAAEYSELLISSGIDLSLKDIGSNTVFHLCLRKGDAELLQSMLDAAERQNSKTLLQALQITNRSGQTPLQLSSSVSSSAVTGLLKRAYDVCAQKECKRLGIKKMDKRFISEHWLTMIGLPQYKDVFFKNDVSGLVLLRLTEEMLKKDLGVDSLGHRMTILQASKALASTSTHPASLESLAPDAGSRGEMGDGCEEFMKEAYKWEILEEELDVREWIGRGFFGEVRRAIWRELDVATKTIYRESSRTRYLSKKGLTYKEMAILSQLRHPNILNFLGFVKTSEGNIMIVTELMPNGSLHKLIRYDFETVCRLRHRIVLDIARGMAYLHSRRLVHRDLNTKNLLLDVNYMTKISDFGLSRIRDEMNNMSVLVGFLGAMAPEVFKGEKYSEKADVFSFAMVLYEILTGKEACQLEGASLLAYANSVANQGYRPPWTNQVLQDESLASWRQLVEECWAQDPEDRLSFHQILERITRHSLEQTELHNVRSADVSDDVRYVV